MIWCFKFLGPSEMSNIDNFETVFEEIIIIIGHTPLFVLFIHDLENNVI